MDVKQGDKVNNFGGLISERNHFETEPIEDNFVKCIQRPIIK